MNETARSLLYWGPRALGLFFAGFLSLFALDVFSEGLGVWQTLGALLIHLVPTYLVLAATAVAWRWEGVGALAFALLGVLYIVIAWGKFPIGTYVLISGPLFLIATLFLIGWILRSTLRSPSLGSTTG